MILKLKKDILYRKKHILNNQNLLAIVFFLLLPIVIFATDKKEKFQNPGLLSINGYVHIQWLYDMHDRALTRNTFLLKRGRLEFRYELTDIVAAEIEIGCDKIDLTVKDAYIEYQASSMIRLIAGLKKMPFSYEEITPVSKLLLIERTETNKLFGDYKYLGRDIGLAVEGEIFKYSMPVGYSFGIYNGNGDRVFKDNNNAKQFAERITIKPSKLVTVGINATQRNDSLTGKLVTAWGGDIVYCPDNLKIESEMLFGNSVPDQHILGVYVTGAYRTGAFEPCLRIEQSYSDLQETEDGITQLTIGCNYYPHRKVQLKTNWVSDIDNAWNLEHKFIVQAQVNF